MGNEHITKSEQALVHMLRNDIVTSDGLNSLWGKSYGGDTLRDIKRRGWATKIEIEHKVGEKARKYRYTCFAITQKGINYLYKRGYDIDAIAGDYAPIYEYRPRKRATPAKAVARLIKEIIANIFFTQYGAVTLPVAVPNRDPAQSAQLPGGPNGEDNHDQPDKTDEYDDDEFFCVDEFSDDGIETISDSDTTERACRHSKPFIPDLILSQQKREIKSWENAAIPGGTYLFCARSTLRKSRLFQHEYKKIAMSECAGILATSRKSVLVYTATSDGMPWNSYSAAGDTAIAKAFNFNHHIQNSISERAEGVLLATTPSVVASVFFNRSKRKMRSRFGTGLSSLYIVPATNEGMALITHIMQDDLVNYRRHLCKRLCETGEYVENDDMQSKSEYPAIEAATGTLCAYGIDMDFNLIVRWYDILQGEAAAGLPLSIKILCFDFQVPFYNAIFKDIGVEYITTNF